MPYCLSKALLRRRDRSVGLDHEHVDDTADHVCVQPTATALPRWSLTCEVCKSFFEDVSSASG
jgi:hypothetical protein